jgi:hypothetical protein
MVWAEIRLAGRLWANGATELTLSTLSSDLVFHAAMRAFLVSALFAVPTYFLLKGIGNLGAALASMWLGLGLSVGNLLVAEFAHMTTGPGLWIFADPVAGAIAGLVAWSVLYRLRIWVHT